MTRCRRVQVLVCASRVTIAQSVVVVGSWQSFDTGAVDPSQEGQVISGLYDVCLSVCLSVCPVNLSAYQACLVCPVKSDIKD
jgi:hypothetical protein